MTDLVDSLNMSTLSLPYNNSKIPCLLYADDIVLMVQTETELQKMLSITNDFVMQFNDKKSKVMIIGKRIDHKKKWHLGKLLLPEVNEYKYLGVMFNRSLKETSHIKYIEKKAKNMKNYITITLEKHCNIKRFDFGSTIFNSMMMPALLHGCPTWVLSKTAISKLNAFQYSAGQAIFQIKSKPARDALLGDLGWKPLCDILEKRQLEFFNYLNYDLPTSSLPHKVLRSLLQCYKEGKESYWKFISNIQRSVTDKGLDDVIYRNDCDWFSTFVDISKAQRLEKFHESISNHDSLYIYKNLKTDYKLEDYLKNDLDFYGAKLKFLARCNNFCLETNYEKWGKSDGICKFCALEVKDTIHHRLLLCPFFTKERSDFYNNVNTYVSSDLCATLLASSNDQKIMTMLGDNVEWGHDTNFSLDKIVKQFLVKMFKPRTV